MKRLLSILQELMVWISIVWFIATVMLLPLLLLIYLVKELI